MKTAITAILLLSACGFEDPPSPSPEQVSPPDRPVGHVVGACLEEFQSCDDWAPQRVKVPEDTNFRCDDMDFECREDQRRADDARRDAMFLPPGESECHQKLNFCISLVRALLEPIKEEHHYHHGK